MPLFNSASGTCFFSEEQKSKISQLISKHTWANDYTGIGRRAYIYLYDENGTILDSLASIRSQIKAEVASTQKIITAFVLSKNNDINYDNYIRYDSSQKTLDLMGSRKSRNFIYSVKTPKGNVKLKNHIKGLLDYSANSSGRAIALYHSDSETAFVKEMNTEVNDILDDEKMNSCFQNGHGLQPWYKEVKTGYAQKKCGTNKQFSTAENMARLMMKFSLDLDFQAIVKDAGLDITNFSKTGYTKSSGFGRIGTNLIATGPCKGNYISYAFFGGRKGGQKKNLQLLMDKLLIEINSEIPFPIERETEIPQLEVF